MELSESTLFKENPSIQMIRVALPHLYCESPVGNQDYCMDAGIGTVPTDNGSCIPM